MNILVTGGAGFIGANLIRYIIDQPCIGLLVNLDCLTYAGNLANLHGVDNNSKYRFEKVDLRDKNEVIRVVCQHRITHVVHLAAESHVDRSISGPGLFIQTNVVGTFNLLEACRVEWEQSYTRGCCRFLHVSTDEVYGSLGPAGYFSETTSYAPSSPYSASKAASDHLVRAYFNTYNFPAVTTNCSNNYGPYQFPEKLIPVVIGSVLSRQPVPVYGDGMNVRDWLFVMDHVEALWRVLNCGRLGETYNIGGNNERSNICVVEEICDLIDESAPEIGGNSRKLIRFVKDRPGHDKRYAIDATKIKSELGWKPAHSFTEGIRKTVQWYLRNPNWVKGLITT